MSPGHLYRTSRNLFQRLKTAGIVVFLVGLLGTVFKDKVEEIIKNLLASMGHTAGGKLFATYRISLTIETDSTSSAGEALNTTVAPTGWIIICIIAALLILTSLLVWLIYRSILSLREQLNIDPKTGILGLRGLKFAFQDFQGRKRGVSSPVDSVMVLIDLMAFKEINKIYAQSGGDKVLVEVAHLLRGETKNKEFVGRIGGDEFMLLMEGPPQAIILALKSRQKILNPCAVYDIGPEIYIPFRAGIVKISDESFDLAYEKASQALQSAKLISEKFNIEEPKTYVAMWTVGLSAQAMLR